MDHEATGYCTGNRPNALAGATIITHNASMLLIFPPVAKPCEPPAGITRIAGVMQANGISCRLLDANLEGLLWLLERPCSLNDTWSRRAARNLGANLAALRDPKTYRKASAYGLAVRDLNRLLNVNTDEYGCAVGLSDYRHRTLSPLRSSDLLAAAEHPEQSPFYHYFNRRLEELFHEAKEPISLAGFSINFLSQALPGFAMIGFVRKRYPGIKIVVGGGLVSSWMKRPGWHDPFAGLVDSMVSGPGELLLLAMAGKGLDKPLPGIPEYNLLPLHDYLSPGFILPYSAASGCYWNACSFCPERAEGNSYQPLPVPRVLQELRILAESTSPALIHILDNAISPSLLQALAGSPTIAPWYGFARFGRELENAEFCRELRRSGCVMLKLGLESGDQQLLDRLNKGIDLASAARILANLKAAGIKSYLYLLFGTPAESEIEAGRTLAFITSHQNSIDHLNLALFNMPVAGDEAGHYATREFYEGDLSLYTNFRHPRGWHRQQVRKFISHEIKRNPAVAAILRNDPPFFTSNHAPFFAP